MRSARSFTFSFLALVALVALSGQALATTVAVGSCTSHVNFATIQQAVSASPSGTTIQICPGTYAEQVTINESLTLEGIAYANKDQVVIVPPAGGVVANAVYNDPQQPNGGIPEAAQILVENASTPITVAINNLTVDGTGNGIGSAGSPNCATNIVGILFSNASGKVNHVAVRNQIPGDALNGCQSGEGIYVQTSTGSSVVTVENSSVHNYNKNGITGNDAGTTLSVFQTYVQGAGPLGEGFDAQNGILIGFGATGNVTSSTVVDNTYVASGTTASDILLYDAAENGGTVIASNTLDDSQIPIGIYTDTPGTYGDGVTVTSNKILGAYTFDGIDVCTNNNTVKGNTIFNSEESGIHLDASCGTTGTGNTVTTNTMLESECAGILDDTSSNTIGSESYFTVPYEYATSTSKCSLSSGAATLAKANSKAKRRFTPAP